MPAALIYARSSSTPPVPARWAYLGNHSAELERWTHAYGESRRIRIGRRLEQTGERLRKPFVEWMNEVVSRQCDPDQAWMLTFTSRSPESSDFYLSLCFLTVAEELAREAPEGHDTALIVECPWLFALLRARLPEMPAVGFARAKLDRGFRRVYWRARTPLARVSLFFRGLARIARARRLFPKPAPDEQAVALVSYAIPGAVRTVPYVDSFFGDLPEHLRPAGFKPAYVFPLHTPSGLFAPIARIEGANVLARWAGVTDLVRTLFACACLRGGLPPFAGGPVDPLVRRELGRENAANQFALNLWQQRTWKRFARHARGAVVHIFENHPWEKGLNRALAGGALRTIGYQHSTAPSLLMNYIPGGRAEERYHPGRILANSAANQKLLLDYGWPAARVGMGGALRYVSSGPTPKKNGRATSTPGVPGISALPTLYVALPGVPKLAANFLADLAETCRRRKPRVRLLLKSHPSLPLDLSAYADVSQFAATTRPLRELLEEVDGVLFVSSTLGLEALLHGLPAIRYLPDGDLSLNPVPPELRSRVLECDFDSLGDVLCGGRFSAGGSPRELDAEAILFSPFQREAWLAALRGTP